MNYFSCMSSELPDRGPSARIEYPQGLIPGGRADGSVSEQYGVLYRICVSADDLVALGCGQIPHSKGILGMVQLSDGRICSAGSDNDLRVWSRDMKSCEKVLKGHTNSVGMFHGH